MSLRRSSVSMVALMVAFASQTHAQEMIFDKARTDYDALGARVGSFVAKPTLNVEQVFDDNIFKSQTGETDDSITKINPALTVESDWSRHSLAFNANGDFSIYNDNDDENYENFGAGMDLRLDVLRDTSFSAGIGYDVLHEDRGSADNPSGATEPTEYSITSANVGVFRGVSSFSANLTGSFKQFDYDDGKNSSGGNIENDDRDRDVMTGKLRLGYEFIPNYQAFVEGSINSRDYDILDGSVTRDSDGYKVIAGSSINLTGKMRGEVFAGYMSQEYDDTTLDDIEDATFGASLLWNPTQLTSVSLGVTRDVQETTFANNSGFVGTIYSLDIEHELMRNLLVGVDFMFERDEYEANSTVTNEREDDIIMAGANIKYLLSRNVAVNLGYDYSERDSNQDNSDYEANVFSVGLGLGF